MEGWNTIYLGANVPTAGIIDVLRNSNWNVLAISASMTFHIPAVREVITSVRSASPSAKILVGGYAFKVAPHLWSQVGADHWTKDALEAVSLLRRYDEANPIF
jgi:methanogenic corrinoid protein MtbC1